MFKLFLQNDSKIKWVAGHTQNSIAFTDDENKAEVFTSCPWFFGSFNLRQLPKEKYYIKAKYYDCLTPGYAGLNGFMDKFTTYTGKVKHVVSFDDYQDAACWLSDRLVKDGYHMTHWSCFNIVKEPVE